MIKIKDDDVLIGIWREYEKDTIGGVNNFNALNSNEKNRLFDLVANGEHL